MFMQFLKRIRMHRMITRAQKILLHASRITEDNGLDWFTRTERDIQTLHDLHDAHCLKVGFRSDGSVRDIHPGDKTYLYSIERSELWLNRFISFCAGVASTLVAEALIRTLLSR